MARRLAVAASLVGLTLAACGQGTPAASAGPGVLAVGSPAIDFKAGTLDGSTVRLSALRGHAVLINFWATWCTACRSEMPAIQQAWDRDHARGFDVVAIDYRESDRDGMRRFLAAAGVRYGSALDPDGVIAQAYGVSLGLPVSVFVDRGGRVALIQTGPMAPDFIDQNVTALL
jgi:cytochrome c biogenesis protein CcmG, thiol:disulfide interchange protein DsbE